MDELDGKYFELLLTEKDLADSMVKSYPDLGLKVFGLFGAGGVLIGWLFGKDAGNGVPPPSIGVACLVLAVVSCAIVVQAVNTYCLTLGYIQYRNEYLNRAFRDYLKRDENPIQAVARWGEGAAKLPTIVSNVVISTLHIVVCIALLLIANRTLPSAAWSNAGLVIGWITLVATIATQIVLFRAMQDVFNHN